MTQTKEKKERDTDRQTDTQTDRPKERATIRVRETDRDRKNDRERSYEFSTEPYNCLTYYIDLRGFRGGWDFRGQNKSRERQ